eukprot:1490467-Amphidinium_carterae.1
MLLERIVARNVVVFAFPPNGRETYNLGGIAGQAHSTMREVVKLAKGTMPTRGSGGRPTGPYVRCCLVSLLVSGSLLFRASKDFMNVVTAAGYHLAIAKIRNALHSAQKGLSPTT